jgi:hypothetical protein
MTDLSDSNTDPKLLTIQLPLWKWQEYVTGHESIAPLSGPAKPPFEDM